MYTAFAQVYDLLMADVDYAAWARLYQELLGERGVKPGAAVCECACGTGSLTLALKRLGFDMTGVDLSAEMLQAAGEKARRLGLAIPFARQDMRALRLHHPVDAVLATCDGVNYLLTEDDLRAFLLSARQALRPGGCLAFDLSTPWKLANELGNNLLCDDTPEATYMWQNTWHPRKQTVEMNLCVFRREPDGRYTRVDESQTQRAWAQPDLLRLLAETGYQDIRVCAEKTLHPPAPREKRWHLSGVKREEFEVRS